MSWLKKVITLGAPAMSSTQLPTIRLKPTRTPVIRLPGETDFWSTRPATPLNSVNDSVCIASVPHRPSWLRRSDRPVHAPPGYI